MKLQKIKENQDKVLSKYIKRLIKLIEDVAGLNQNADKGDFYYLGYFLNREYFLNQDIVYVTTYNDWTRDVMENETNSITLVDLYAIKLLKECPESVNDIEFRTLIKSDKFNCTENDFLTWIGEPSEITEAIDLPYYKIVEFLKTNPKPKNKFECELIKQVLKPDLILHEWPVHRIFCKPDKFSNVWVYDHPKSGDEPYFFLTDSLYIQNTTKIAVINFKTPEYRKEDYSKGIYKRGNVKRKLWKLDENYIKELIEFLKSPSTIVEANHFTKEYARYYKKHVKTKWQEMIFEYNHNLAGWGWGKTGFNIPPEKDTDRLSDTVALSFDLPMPDYMKLNK